MGLNEKFFKSAAGGITASDNFEPVIYTGNGGTKSITSLNFQPDFTWIKQRSSPSRDHVLNDSVRGANKILYSNLTNAEDTAGGSGSAYFNSFDSNGFTVGSSIYYNGSSLDYVAWNWKAGGAAVSNTDGTITSQVSANVDAGFSIVSYTGASANQNVGHGLDETPQLIIVKNRDTAGNGWATQSPFSGGADYHMMLNLTQEAKNNVDWIWNDTEPTSSVFSIGQNGITNTSGDKYIGYCFHSVDGYSKIGSYTGGGATNVTVNLGFSPRFVMIKRVNAVGNWTMYDNVRQTGSVPYDNYTILLADDAYQEQADDTIRGIQFTSTGIVLNKNYDLTNTSGSTYLYLAIA